MHISEAYISYLDSSEQQAAGRLVRSLKSMGESGLLLFRDTQNPSPLTFKRQPEYAKGRKSGFNKIYFGDLGDEPVAIKFIDPEDIDEDEGESAEQNIANEYTISKHLSRSDAPAPEVIGAAKIKGSFAVITAFEQDLESFDNLFWHDTYAPTNDEVRYALTCAAMSLIALHSSGIAHADFGVQNTAHDKATRSARTSDITSAHYTNNPYDYIRDILSYLSTANHGDSKARHVHVNAAHAHEALLDPYVEGMRDTSVYPSKQLFDKEISQIRKNVPTLLGTRL